MGGHFKEPRVVEASSLPTFYIDDLCRADVHGVIVRITCGEYRYVGKELVLMPVVEIIRPLERDLVRRAQEMITAAMHKDDAPESLAHH